MESTRKLFDESQEREQSYIQRLSDLELQLQRERERADSAQPTEDHKERIEVLTRNIDNLVLEQENLQLALSAKVGLTNDTTEQVSWNFSEHGVFQDKPEIFESSKVLTFRKIKFFPVLSLEVTEKFLETQRNDSEFRLI